ncbi:hypothetical protein ES332_D08G298400v1 [Gossypium tomentosum]|uniref:Uncharacterized protein n=1 Tax=Gossypium tomentosum TaxID=34277 RepID=A0A5D2K061_GOSTO|nr:hypothetical protein ES332_D08G298400v1 [Gossypium tomentosum]
MQRSSSLSNTNRLISDEIFVNLPPSTMATCQLLKATIHPTIAYRKIAYNRHHDMTGEKVIHLIPVVLFLCAFTLWFFSLPADSKI